MDSPDLLTPQAAADHLGVTPNWLAKLRMQGKGPAYRKLGGRLIRYPATDLNAWIEAGLRTSTSDSGTAT